MCFLESHFLVCMRCSFCKHYSHISSYLKNSQVALGSQVILYNHRKKCSKMEQKQVAVPDNLGLREMVDDARTLIYFLFWSRKDKVARILQTRICVHSCRNTFFFHFWKCYFTSVNGYLSRDRKNCSFNRLCVEHPLFRTR